MLLDREMLVQRAEESENRAKQRISEVVTLHEIGQAVDKIEIRQLLQLITDRAALLMDAQACSLMLVHPEIGSLRVEASHGLPDDAMEQEQRVGEGIAHLGGIQLGSEGGGSRIIIADRPLRRHIDVVHIDGDSIDLVMRANAEHAAPVVG